MAITRTVRPSDVHVITDIPTPDPTPFDASATVTVDPPKKILIATPCYGGMVTESYMRSLLAVVMQAQREGVDVDVYTSAGESLVTRARNEAVHAFLAAEKGYTHLLFIDADISFTWENFSRLMNSGYDLAAGVYPLKTVNWAKALGKTPNDVTELIASTVEVVVNAVDPADENGFSKCLDAGTGFMWIARPVFERMAEAHPEIVYTQDELHASGEKVYAFFDTMIRDGRYLSEDYTFCRRWQDLGEFVYVDMGAPLLQHQGTYHYGKVG